MIQKTVTLFVVLMLGMIAATSMAFSQGNNAQKDGQDIAHAYIAGMESGDLDALTQLFLPDDRSSILENASDEGSWEHYRDHHLKPEIENTDNFEISIADESVEHFGEVTLVRQTGSFSVDVEGQTSEFRVAVSYFIVLENNQQRIAHLHGSSRPDQRPAAQP